MYQLSAPSFHNTKMPLTVWLNANAFALVLFADKKLPGTYQATTTEAVSDSDCRVCRRGSIEDADGINKGIQGLFIRCAKSDRLHKGPSSRMNAGEAPPRIHVW